MRVGIAVEGITADMAEIGLDAPRNHMPYKRVTHRRRGDVRSLDQLSECHDDITRRSSGDARGPDVAVHASVKRFFVERLLGERGSDY